MIWLLTGVPAASPGANRAFENASIAACSKMPARLGADDGDVVDVAGLADQQAQDDDPLAQMSRVRVLRLDVLERPRPRVEAAPAPTPAAAAAAPAVVPSDSVRPLTGIAPIAPTPAAVAGRATSDRDDVPPTAPAATNEAIGADAPLAAAPDYAFGVRLDPGPRPLEDIEPEYPDMTHLREGVVVLRLLISETGHVDDVAVVRAAPRGVFEQAAIEAFSQGTVRARAGRRDAGQEPDHGRGPVHADQSGRPRVGPNLLTTPTAGVGIAALRYSSSSVAESGHAVDEIENGPVTPRSEVDLASSVGPVLACATSTTPAASASSPTSRAQKSHAIVEQGLKILENLDHRGAVGADKLMGDGAGILIQIPDEFYRAEMAAQGVALPPPGEYGVGMVFLPQGARLAPGLRAGDRARDQGRGPGAARLARRAGRPRDADVAGGARQGAGASARSSSAAAPT